MNANPPVRRVHYQRRLYGHQRARANGGASLSESRRLTKVQPNHRVIPYIYCTKHPTQFPSILFPTRCVQVSTKSLSMPLCSFHTSNRCFDPLASAHRVSVPILHSRYLVRCELCGHRLRTRKTKMSAKIIEECKQRSR